MEKSIAEVQRSVGVKMLLSENCLLQNFCHVNKYIYIICDRNNVVL